MKLVRSPLTFGNVGLVHTYSPIKTFTLEEKIYFLQLSKISLQPQPDGMKAFHHFLLISCLVFPLLTQAQDKASPPRLGLGMLGWLYTGDLTVDESEYLRMYPGANVYLQFANHRPFRFRANAGFGKIVEQVDRPLVSFESERIPNTYFETNLFYIDLRLMRYFLRDKKVKPFLGFGPSLFFFNPKDQDGNFLIDNIFTRQQGEEFPTTTFVWPATLGLSLAVNDRLSVNVDYTYRLNMSDYVDNIGLLGDNPGRDQVHAFQVSMDLDIGKESVIRLNDTPEEKSEAQLPVMARQDRSKRVLGELSYREIEAEHHLREDRIRKEELAYLMYREAAHSPQLPRGEVYTPASPRKANPSYDEATWKALKEEVFEKELFKTVYTRGRLSAEAWAQAYHLSLEEFEELNPGLPELIAHHTAIRVPDWEAVWD